MPKKQRRSVPHWIIPLSHQLSPYLKQIQNPAKYTSRDELVIPTDLLPAFRATDPYTRALRNFDDILGQHLRCTKKMVLKDMGQPFGKGAFAGPEGMKRGDAMIYGGIYSDSDGSKDSDCHYRAELFANFQVDGINIWSMGRYVQHLPTGITYARVASHDPTAAEENATLKTCNVSITLNGYPYIIPVSRLILKEDVNADEMLGFDYGSQYWSGDHRLPSYFDRMGKPLDIVGLTMNTGLTNLTFYLTRENEKLFLQRRYLQYTFHDLFILPESVTELAPEPINANFIPAIYYISSAKERTDANRLHYQLTENGDVVLLPLNEDHHTPDSKNTQDLLNFVESLPCQTMLVTTAQGRELGIYLSDIARLRYDNAKRLLERLDSEVNPASKYLFYGLIDPVIQKKNLVAQNKNAIAALGFFNARRSQQNLQPPEEKKDNSSHMKHCF